MSIVVRSLFTALSVVPLLQAGRRLPWLSRTPSENDANFVAVADLAELEDVFAASGEGTIVLFLHDPFCPVSAGARRRVREAGGEVFLVNVSRQHELNHAIAERTGVRHESPQAFVLRDGKPIWYASHAGITTEGLTTARDR
jgi:bacillithiol system protein YtxJ